MKNMFYYSGLPNGGDGRCFECPFWILERENGHGRCAENNQAITEYVKNGRINKSCPFLTK